MDKKPGCFWLSLFVVQCDPWPSPLLFGLIAERSCEGECKALRLARRTIHLIAIGMGIGRYRKQVLKKIMNS